MRLDQLPGIDAIEPELLRSYLRSQGWRLDQEVAPDIYAYSLPAGSERVQVDVVGRQYRDFRKRTAELVEMLAQIQGCSPLALLEDLSTPEGDVIEVRLESELTRSGTIPLADAVRIRQAQQGLLLSAAHAALKPMPHYPRLSRREAVELLSRCREGQTARGSYLTRLIIPVEPLVGQVAIESLGRQAVQVLVQAARISAQAVNADRSEALLESHRQGVSANFLSSLADLAPPGEQGRLDLRVRWSRNRPAPEPAAPIQIERWAFEHFRSAALTLKARNPERGVRLEGYVVKLSRPPGAGQGSAVMMASIDDGSLREVLVPLSEGPYNDALEAHRRQQPVEVFGTLQQAGRRLVLREPAGLRPLQTDDEDLSLEEA